MAHRAAELALARGTAIGRSKKLNRNLSFAVLIDYDNVAIRVMNALHRRFEYKYVAQWLGRRGKILEQIAYANWNTFHDTSDVSRRLKRQGVRMKELAGHPNALKNGADIALAVEAMEILHDRPEINAFCLLSGDSDFRSLLKRLKDWNKHVCVVAGPNASGGLRHECDEFVRYANLCNQWSRSGAETGAAAVTWIEECPPVRALAAIQAAIRWLRDHGERADVARIETEVLRHDRDFDPLRYGCKSLDVLIDELVDLGHLEMSRSDRSDQEVAEPDMPPNSAELVRGYRQLAEKGDAEAHFYLGSMYEGGKGVAQDPSAAVHHYRQAAKQGHARAHFSLGCMYEGGNGVQQDPSAAEHHYREAAKRGSAWAQYNLGLMLLGDEVSPQDPCAAAECFRKAAEQGLPDAQINLGLMHYHAMGVPGDHAQAMHCFRMAAVRGSAEAQYRVSEMYAHGEGVPRDLVAAHMWLSLAASQRLEDSARAEELRDWLANKMTAAQIAEAEVRANEWRPIA